MVNFWVNGECWYTQADVARILGVSHASIHKRRKEGSINDVSILTIGSREYIMISANEIERHYREAIGEEDV